MQRHCIFMVGDKGDFHNRLQPFLKQQNASKVIYVDNSEVEDITVIPHNKTQQYLGKEFDLVVFDATEQFYPDSFGAIVGTLVAGGVLIILINSSSVLSPYQQRLITLSKRACQQYDHFYWCEAEDALPTLSSISNELDQTDFQLTLDQQQAVVAIQKVVMGHRRRPLVLSSDRGRGKTAALGIAATELLKMDKQNIIVTAPSLATVETFFLHAQRALPTARLEKSVLYFEQAEIRFIAPDLLINSDLKADLVLVDEAAAIPSSMLDQLLHQYARIVFATTLHGYEGTGRGFTVRFQKQLDEFTPDWRHQQMSIPIRWGDDDQLEQFSFDALLLNAEPVEANIIEGALPENCDFERLDQLTLSQNETQLRQLFGLMVLAHYRTRPSDLQMLLDRDDVIVYVLRYQDHIVGSVWLVEEGDLDNDLAEAVYNATRRINGHLLPQSLLAHAGLSDAGRFKYQRIIRIGIHPAIQQQGFGQYLIGQIEQSLQQVDCLGASFAINNDLTSFWQKTGFTPVRLGLHHDEISGSQALMVLKACSDSGDAFIQEASQRMQQQWSFLLRTIYQHLHADIVITISQWLPSIDVELANQDRNEIKAFAYSQRAYEASQVSLWNWCKAKIHHADFLTLTRQQQHLLVMMILQQKKINDVADKLDFNGRKQVVSALRYTVSKLLS